MDKDIILLSEPCTAAALFGDWKETLIYSCLQGVMGQIYADNEDMPESVAAVMGDFCFLAGKPDARFVSYDYGRNFLIMDPQNDEWAQLIEAVCGGRALRRMRYAIKKEPDCFDREKLRDYIRELPPQYELKQIDREIYRECLENEWSRDLVACFPSWEEFERLGLGMVVAENNHIVSGAASYTRYLEGIEIEIDTKKEYRRQGLATAAGAALILECLDRGLYPSWDAQNLWSVALAEKLGYSFDYEYPVYEVRWKRNWKEESVNWKY
ncbi:MAG: GNAT family N-acetyltransferase [Coprococcus sp.]